MNRCCKVALSTLVGFIISLQAEGQSFGGQGDQEFAGKLWQALVAARLAGAEAMQSKPYPGQHPHGAVLQNWESSVSVDGQQGAVIVKRNYGGEGVSVQAVSEDPEKFLGVVTVMFQRPGYDPDNNDWFWARYLPDGSLDSNPKGTPMAGRVAKGDTQGCIACHSAAPGGDLVFTNDRYNK